MIIEPLSAADHREVSALLRACFEWVGQRDGFTPRQIGFLTGERSSEQTLRAESGTRPHLVAREAGRIMGVAAIKGNELARLYVHPRDHRKGVGQALFAAAEQMIRKAGHGEMTVAALVPSAVAFYQAMGMAVVGQERYEPEIFPDRPVVILSKPL